MKRTFSKLLLVIFLASFAFQTGIAAELSAQKGEVVKISENAEETEKNIACTSLGKVGSGALNLSERLAKRILSLSKTVYGVSLPKKIAALVMVGFVIQKTYGEDVLLTKFIVPLTQNLGYYVTAVVATLVKAVVSGFKAPIDDCFNSEECILEIQDFIGNATKITGKGIAIGAEGVGQGLFDLIKSDPVGSVKSALGLAVYGGSRWFFR